MNIPVILLYILYFAITISILVFVHEFGHFIAAKICKMRTDVFAIGFGKRLIGWNKKIGFKFGSLPENYDGEGTTDYRLSILPLGGYVKIAGMIDESFDTKFAESEPKPYEFRAKPTYQKLFVISAGVLMNIILTVVIFWMLVYVQGKTNVISTTISRVSEYPFAQKAGFQNKDKVISINGVKVFDWESLNLELAYNAGKDIEAVVIRNGQEVKVDFSGNLIAEAAPKGALLYPLLRPLVDEAIENQPAQLGGMKKGDLFVSINSTEVESREEATKIIEENKGKPVEFVVQRGNDLVKLTVTPSAAGKIGVQLTQGPINFKKYGFWASFVESFSMIKETSLGILRGFKEIIVGKASVKSSLGGPITIAQYAKNAADEGGFEFLRFLALLSLSLAVINILPFPVLDGGHIVIISLEGIFRRELPIKIKIFIQNVGFVILLGLMALIIYFDVLKL